MSFVNWVSAPNQSELKERLDLFVTVVLYHVAMRFVTSSVKGATPSLIVCASLIFLSLFLFRIDEKFKKTAVLLALTVASLKIVSEFYRTANHAFLELIVLALLASYFWASNKSEDDLKTLFSSLKWVVILVLFWSAIQKMLYGTYFNGSFFMYEAASGDRRFISFLKYFIDRETVEAGLKSNNFATSNVPILFFSNSVYVGELVAAVLLFKSKFEKIGLVVTVGVLCGIEFFAREVIFGLLVAILLTNFMPIKLTRVVTRILFFAYVAVWMIRLFFPEVRVT